MFIADDMDADFSRLARRFVVERHRRGRGTLTFLCGHELAQFSGVLNGRAGVGMFSRPLARVFTEAMDVAAGFARQFIFDPLDFFKNRTRFHQSILPSIPTGCKRWAIASQNEAGTG